MYKSSSATEKLIPNLLINLIHLFCRISRIEIPEDERGEMSICSSLKICLMEFKKKIEDESSDEISASSILPVVPTDMVEEDIMTENILEGLGKKDIVSPK